MHFKLERRRLAVIDVYDPAVPEIGVEYDWYRTILPKRAPIRTPLDGATKIFLSPGSMLFQYEGKEDGRADINVAATSLYRDWLQSVSAAGDGLEPRRELRGIWRHVRPSFCYRNVAVINAGLPEVRKWLAGSATGDRVKVMRGHPTIEGGSALVFTALADERDVVAAKLRWR